MTEGLTVSHACEIAAVCREIKTLLQMEETVEGIDDDKQIQTFLYNLSAFLLELGCPYEEFSSGPIDARFSDAEARNRLVNYLKDEFKAAQLTAAQRLENLKPDSVEEDEDRVLLCSALEAVGSTYSNQPLGEIFSLLYQEVDKRMQRFVTAPKIMFKASMDENKWRQVEECCAMLLKDFRARTILLLKRLDVSVNSFLWTDRLQKMEDEIRGEYARRIQPHLIRYNPMQVWHLLAATDDILYIESASNYANRRNTKCPTHPLATGKAPKDRGGRTSEQTPVRNETFTQQQSGRDNPRGRGRGGGQHHGGGRGRGNYQQQHQAFDRRSNEQRVMYLASISRNALLQCSKCAVGGQRTWLRGSTTGVFKNLDKLIIYDEDDAYEIASRLTASEQELLGNALKTVAQQKGSHSPLSSAQTRQLFVVNTLPFIGFGMLDNMIMIVAGEYIDQQLGVYLTISTMAAAALGNLISDVAGVGLAHYVEILIHRCGFRSPVLSSEQLETPKTRFVINCARAIGLTIGCLIGMFPLLFFDEDKKD